VLRIALVSREFHPLGGGGIGVQMAAGAAALTEVAEVTVITSSSYESQYRELVRAGEPCLHPEVRMAFVEEPVPGEHGSYFGFMHLYSTRVYQVLRELYGSRGPDLIEFADFLGEGLVTVQGRRGGDQLLRETLVCVRMQTSAELCSVLNGYMAHDFDTRVVLAGERHALRFADHTISPGGDVLGTYRRYYGPDALAPSATLRCLIPAGPHAIKEPPPVEHGIRFLYMGRLERRKGVEDLIRAVTGLRRDDWTLTLVGGDTTTAPLGMSMRDQLELAVGGDERIQFVKGLPREQVPALVGDHHVVVVPSRWECWPSVILEALEANRPVLATPTGGMVEMVGVPGAGWLSDDVGDSALAAAFDRLLERPEEIASLIEGQSPRRAHARLTDPDEFREGYVQLAGSRPRAASLNGRPAKTASEPPPLVSVVVPYFALDRYVEDTVRSIFTQDYPRLEVILVNDGSLRPEDRVVKELSVRYPVHVVTQQNSGLGRARNTGVAVSRGRYVLPLDADNMIKPEFIRRCVDVLDREPEVAYVTTWSRYIDEEGKELEGLGAGYQPIGNATEVMRAGNVGGDAAAVIRRRIFDLGHQYNPHLTSFEDWQLYRELFEAGLYGRVIPERLLLYRVRKGSMIREIGFKRDARLHGEMRALLQESRMQWVSKSD
jgi:glycogen synthase